MLLNAAQEFVCDGDVVWDIRANVGLFTFAAASKSRTGKCLAVEPDIWLCHLLRKSAQHNPDLKVDILPVAVTDTVGLAKFNIAVRSRSTNYLENALGSTQTGGVRDTYVVPAVTLDFILSEYDAPNFVKIDTEGAEHFVLRGATQLLSQAKPIVLCEVAGENFAEVSSILLENDYKLYDGDLLPEKINASPKTANILALPNK